MCDELSNLEEQPWNEFNRGRPITPRNLAMLLKHFKITPIKENFGLTSKRGYKSEQFKEVFLRYLPNNKSEKSDTENEPTTPKPSSSLDTTIY